MPLSPVTTGAIIGSTLMALLLTGSSRTAADSTFPYLTFEASEFRVLGGDASALYKSGRYTDARAAFRTIALRAQNAGNIRASATHWNNAAVCSLVESQYSVALQDFLKARRLAEPAHENYPLAITLLNLANLYIHTGQFELSIRVANDALALPSEGANAEAHPKLLLQLATAMAELHRLKEAMPVYRKAIAEQMDQNDLYSAAVSWGEMGHELVKADQPAEAEWALSEALRLMRVHRLRMSSGVLTGLATLKGLQGDSRAAESLFSEALALPPNLTPRNRIYLDRGEFRLRCGDLAGALADFREARNIFTAMRAEMVPADQDRVALESGLSRMYEGLVDAGNRLALTTGDKALLKETFDAAEESRLWSLRALVPSPNDWRTKLPDRYWELLARYQSLERAALAKATPELEKKTGSLRLELQQVEASAAGHPARENTGSPLEHVRSLLDADTVLLSFHTSETSSWIWTVDRSRIDVYRLPPVKALKTGIDTFGKALRSGAPATETGSKLYRDLFGAIPASYLQRKHWLLELDGGLFEVPFAALVVGEDEAHRPVYLTEKAELQSLPNALLAERGEMPSDGGFLGIGDAVYNGADSRFNGSRSKMPEVVLPRLPNTSEELEACAKAWNSASSRLLTGREAQLAGVQAAVESKPAIVHFATHVISGRGDFRTGLIALSLNPAGEMGLLGPREIVSRPISAKLVVMDGCHSAQGDALPSAGLMGLTRAWIGAGAKGVLATQWDIPDNSAQSLMTDFYRELRASPRHGAAAALRSAQIAALRNPGARQAPGGWAGYFLLSRML